MKQFKIIESREIAIPSKDEILAVSGDKNTAQYAFVMPKIMGGVDLSPYKFTMKTLAVGGEAWSDLVKTIEGDNLILKWQISEDQLCCAGTISLQIVATYNSSVWQTIEARARIEKSLTGDPVAPTEPSYFVKLLQDVTLEADRATTQADRAKAEADNIYLVQKSPPLALLDTAIILPSPTLAMI